MTRQLKPKNNAAGAPIIVKSMNGPIDKYLVKGTASKLKKQVKTAQMEVDKQEDCENMKTETSVMKTEEKHLSQGTCSEVKKQEETAQMEVDKQEKCESVEMENIAVKTEEQVVQLLENLKEEAMAGTMIVEAGTNEVKEEAATPKELMQIDEAKRGEKRKLNEKSDKKNKNNKSEAVDWSKIPPELGSLQKDSGKLPTLGTPVYAVYHWLLNRFKDEVGCFASWTAEPMSEKVRCQPADAKMVAVTKGNKNVLCGHSTCCNVTSALSDTCGESCPSLAKYLWRLIPYDAQLEIFEEVINGYNPAEPSTETEWDIERDKLREIERKLNNAWEKGKYKLKKNVYQPKMETEKKKQQEEEKVQPKPPAPASSVVDSWEELDDEFPTLCENNTKQPAGVETSQTALPESVEELKKITMALLNRLLETGGENEKQEAAAAKKYVEKLESLGKPAVRKNAWDKPPKIVAEERKTAAGLAVVQRTPAAKKVLERIPVEIEKAEADKMATALLAIATPKHRQIVPAVARKKMKSVLVRNVASGPYGALRENLRSAGVDTKRIRGLMFRGSTLQAFVEEDYAVEFREKVGRNPRLSFPTAEQFWPLTWRKMKGWTSLEEIYNIRQRQNDRLHAACYGEEAQQQMREIFQEVEDLWEAFCKEPNSQEPSPLEVTADRNKSQKEIEEVSAEPLPNHQQ